MPASKTAPEAAPTDHLMGVYNRAPVAFARGQGVWLYTDTGEAYLDCLAGIAVNALGHSHPALNAALREQSEKLWHVSNIFRIPEQETLAARLCELSFADVCFFTNSGAEAVECALKLVRKHHSAAGQPERNEVIGFEGAFHGRTYATVNAAGNPAYVDGFGPLLPGYRHVPFGDLEALAAAMGPHTAAVILEPVQGEGGARAASDEFLRQVRRLCDEQGALLIFDEIQCGLGRSGRLFTYEYSGMAPDVMCLAKALGGGFPVGACLATASAAQGMTVGAHGSTYGGNPLAMAVAQAALKEISHPSLLAHVRDVAGYFSQQLQGLKSSYPDIIADIRGRGLLIGIKLISSNREFMQIAREQHLLVAGGGDNCIRLLPALIITQDEAREVVSRLEATCDVVRARGAAQAEAAA